MRTVIRKHSAKCIKFTMDDGVDYFFVFIGGVWYYNGRSDFNVATAYADGFWRDSIKKILGNAAIGSLKSVVNFMKHVNKGVVPKNHKLFIRHWTSVKEEGCPF